MMKILVFHMMILLIAACFFPAQGQNSVNIELSFQKSDFNLLPVGEELFRIETSDDSYFYSGEPDHPAVPYRSIDILVPSGANLVDFHFSFESEVYPGAIRLSKNNLPVPSGDSRGESPDRKSSAFSGAFPQEVVKYNSRQIMQGYTWFNFTIAPYIYDASLEILSLVNKLDLTLTYSLKGDQALTPRRDDQVMQAVLERVVNPEDLALLYLNKKKAELKSSPAHLDYLIVTTSTLKEGFLPLIEWKIRKGLKAELITLDEIYTRYDGPTPQLKIKNCLQENYEERSLKWVLLGGDHQLVPVQGCFGSVGMDYEDNAIPTDLFYACFDKSFDWNATVDERIGEPYFDYVDILPEVYIARAPVNSSEQVGVFVKKSIEYELFTPREDFAEKILLAGVKSWNTWDGKSDNHHRSESMYNSFVPSRWPGKRYALYDTGTDFQGAENYNVTVENLSEQINTGYSIFHFAGHGNHSSYLMEESEGFAVKDAFSLRNNFAGIMLSSSCDVNSFDISDPCLSEAFLRNPEGGCVAFWGSSRYAWANPDISSKLGPSFLFNAKFLEYLYNDEISDHAKTFAGLTSMAKAHFSGNGTAAGAYWFLQYSLNAMGDPELPLYSRNPSVFDNVRIYSWENHLVVNTGGVEACRICITSQNLDQGYQVLAEGTSNFTFEDVPESYQVTITKPNHIPYIYKSTLTSDSRSDYLSSIRVYPNPAADIVNIDFNLPQGSLFLYDLNGRILDQKEITMGNNTLSLSGLSKGAYILKVSTSYGTDHVKLIKQ